MSQVAVIRTAPKTVVEDYHKVMKLAGYKKTVKKTASTIIKINSPVAA